MYKLREYQEECHVNTMNYLAQKKTKPGIVVLPTGLGKSLNIAKVAQDYDGSSVIVCPSQEILKQNYAKFKNFGGEASIYSASLNKKDIGRTTFVTLGSVKKLGKEFKDLGVSLLMMDECHLNSDPKGGMFRTFLEDLDPKHIIGYTATPFRLKNYSDPTGYSYSQLTMMTRSRPKFFSKFVHVTQIPYAVKNGFWAPIEVYSEEFDPLGLILNSTGADFTESSIQRVLKANNVNNKIYLKTKSLLKNGASSILIFLDTVDNCYTLAHALGVDVAKVVEARTKAKDRQEIIADFISGKVRVVVCVSTLTTGFDFPELQHVIMGRPTNSLAVFYQIYGRLVRPFEGKTGYFYDYAGNINRFGRMEDMTLEEFPDHGWALFSGENLLTGVPMDGSITTKTELRNMEKIDYKPGISKLFEFGAHIGKPLEDIPKHYIKWALENARSNMTKPLIEECKKIMTTV